MSWRSVRIRLTVLVVGVAALAMVLAATIGVSRIKDSLVDDVLADTATQTLFLDGVIFDEGVEVGVFDEFGEPVLPEDQVPLEDRDPFDIEFFESDLEFFAEELEDLVRQLDRIDALNGLLSAAGSSRADGLPLLTSFGLVATVGIDGAATEFIDTDPFDYDGALLWEFNVQDLVFGGPDFDPTEIFEAALESGDFDDAVFDDLLEQQLAERAEGMEIVSSAVEFEGIDFVVAADIADVTRSVDKIRSVLWSTMPVLVLLAGLATWILTGRALSPVRRMSRQVAVISGGTLHERVPVPTTGDEIQDLGTTMNGMLDRLERDDRRLRQFVSDASHELRSPVAVLRSEAEVALRTPDDTDSVDLAEGVLGESLRLERIVADLLVLARGDESRGPAHQITVDLDDIVLAESARRRAVPVDTQSVSAGQVRGTLEGCRRVVVHLLDNAARHASSTVHIGLHSDDNTVTLWIDDDGPGIPTADRPRVFERFARLEAARTRDAGGAGLGLAVVAATVAAMNGTVAIEDSPLGGARFVVRCPTWPGPESMDGQE